MNFRQILVVVIFFVVLIAATLVGRAILLDRLSVVKLGSAAPLAGAISQSLGKSGASQSLLIAGKDFNLQDVHYFDGKTWTSVHFAVCTNPSVIEFSCI